MLLRFRARSRLTQRQLAERLGIHRRSVQEWEVGATHPGRERLEALIVALLEASALTPGDERAEAEALWAAATREAAHAHAPFDTAWFDRLLAKDRGPLSGPEPALGPRVASADLVIAERRQNWGEAPDTAEFVGRPDELDTLRRWILDEHCRLVAVLGMGGVGKTSLIAHLARGVALSFDRIFWRSLRDSLPASNWLDSVIAFLSDGQQVPATSDAARLTALLQLLRSQHCLLVLDNFESLFEPGAHEERYRAGSAGYGRVLQALGSGMHQSCLVLTSREAPPELTTLSGTAVRSLHVRGLRVDEAQLLLAPKQLTGTAGDWTSMNQRLGGNALALKVIGESIHELFGDDIGAFLDGAGISVFGGLRRLLAEQLDQSSVPEQQVMRTLAVRREAVPLGALVASLAPRLSHGLVLEALDSLRRRSLVERVPTGTAAAFTLHPAVLEYVTGRLIDTVADEIDRRQPEVLIEQPLIQALATEYVRDAQERLIGTPVLQRLVALHREGDTRQRLLELLDGWRGQPSKAQGYGPGNVVNLLRLLGGNLRGLDLSRLTLRQAYLAKVEVQDASLAEGELVESALAEAFSLPVALTLSGDGTTLAAGTTSGQVWLWRTADWALSNMVTAHTGPALGLALSADARVLATSGADRLVRLWDPTTGHLLAKFQGHSSAVWCVALSATGDRIASGGGDGTVRLWSPTTEQAVATLPAHDGVVRGVAISADGCLAASAGEDSLVCLWDTTTGQRLGTLRGHVGTVYSVALSTSGHLVASGGSDGSVRLWLNESADLRAGTWQPLANLSGHTGVVRMVAVSGDGQMIASGGFDGTVRLWQTSTRRAFAMFGDQISAIRGVALSTDGRLLACTRQDGTVRLWDPEPTAVRPLTILQGHTTAVRAVAASADGNVIASGCFEGSVRLWESATDRAPADLRGHRGGVWCVAVSRCGDLAASGGEDGTVRLWDARTEKAVATWPGHTSAVWGVALSADGRVLASAGEDATVRLWEPGITQALATLEGHTSGVLSVAISGDGRRVASSGADGSVRLWEAGLGQSTAVLRGHTGVVWGVALTRAGHLAVSGGEDGSVRVWDVVTGTSIATLSGHTGGVYSVAVSDSGDLIASGGVDGTVRVWETTTGRLISMLEAHATGVYSVALSASGQVLASGGVDGAVRVWDTAAGVCLRLLRIDRRYERMDITDLRGISDTQRAALRALGALDRRSSQPA